MKQLTDDWPCFKTAFLTVNLPCWNSNRHHSSTHGHHPWVSGCLACLVLWLWHPLGAHAWAWAVSHPCPCGLCHGVQYGEDVVARLCGPVQRSWGSAQSQGCLCADQGEPSLLLAHRRTGYVCTKIKKGLNTRWHGLRKCLERRDQVLWNRGEKKNWVYQKQEILKSSAGPLLHFSDKDLLHVVIQNYLKSYSYNTGTCHMCWAPWNGS